MTTERADPPERPRRTKSLLIGAGIVAVIATVLIGWAVWPRGTTEITHEEAVEHFRNDSRAESSPDTGSGDGTGSSGQTDPTHGDSDVAGTPAPGVYTYDASGSEQVKLGPLPTEDRPLPDTVTIVVGDPTQDADDTCFEWTLNLFAEHTEATTWCVSPDDDLRLTAHTKHQSVGALSPTASLSCDPDILVAAGVDSRGNPAGADHTSGADNTGNSGDSGHTDTNNEGRPIACDLHLEGGPATINARMVGTSTASTAEKIDVGTETVRATPLLISYEVSGDLSGTWTEEYWLDEQLLPVRIKRDLELTGPATLTEHSTLRLTDLSPSL